MTKEEEYVADELAYKKEFQVSAKADSSYKARYEQQLPHNKKKKYTPPAGKPRSYTR
jgi:hypothetical protein